MDSLLKAVFAASEAGYLLPASAENIREFLMQSSTALEKSVIAELFDQGAWKELDDRFFRTLAFGTGGLRGKTIGGIVTKAEKGIRQRSDGRPEIACIGTNAVNSYNIVRATRGLVNYVREWHRKEQLKIDSGTKSVQNITTLNSATRPKICISYDTRFFSREFADLVAKVITEHGCDALLFERPRSTPELSFAVRESNATAGINITASHNPPAYNGYKVYFEDGGQVIEPHASAIIEQVNAIKSERYEPLPEAEQGKIIMLGASMDEAYLQRLQTLLLNPALVKSEPRLKVVYTPLHGVGGAIVLPLLKRLGIDCLPVETQLIPDGFFSTVKSPNPENAEALTLGMQLADREQGDLVLATDPDDDRMGVAVRNAAGALELLTGNQIGVLMLWYRLTQLFICGILNEKNKKHAVVIKSLVTTDLQRAIAEKFGVRCVETLTGFKYIGAKLALYENKLSSDVRKNYRRLSEVTSREERLRDSSYFVFGGEESYGYSVGDFVRDKDGNAAVLAFCEVAAYAKNKKITLPELLDQIYCEYGFYLERGESLALEGAEGAKKMEGLMDSYTTTKPFVSIHGAYVMAVKNFATEKIYDSEGELLPAEAMLMIDMEGGRRIVIRPSGTEPKIKFYLFAMEKPALGKFSIAELKAVKEKITIELEELWQWLKADAMQRI